MSFAFYVACAIAEISGCFAFWAWLRLGHSPLWVVPGAAMNDSIMQNRYGILLGTQFRRGRLEISKMSSTTG